MKKKKQKNNDNRRSKQSLSLLIQDVSVYKILYHRLKLLSNIILIGGKYSGKSTN